MSTQGKGPCFSCDALQNLGLLKRLVTRFGKFDKVDTEYQNKVYTAKRISLCYLCGRLGSLILKVQGLQSVLCSFLNSSSPSEILSSFLCTSPHPQLPLLVSCSTPCLPENTHTYSHPVPGGRKAVRSPPPLTVRLERQAFSVLNGVNVMFSASGKSRAVPREAARRDHL